MECPQGSQNDLMRGKVTPSNRVSEVLESDAVVAARLFSTENKLVIFSYSYLQPHVKKK
jgi:hypothetical protein